MVAFIDSGNSTIQMPYDAFKNFYNELKKVETGHIRFREAFDFPANRNVKIINANTECENLVDILPNLRIDIAGGISVEIEPRGYIYPP